MSLFEGVGFGFWIYAFVMFFLTLWAAFNIHSHDDGKLNLSDYSIAFRFIHGLLAWGIFLVAFVVIKKVLIFVFTKFF